MLLTHAFNLPTRAFNLATCAFSLLTCAFELVTRRFKLITHESELVTREFELVTRGFELVTCEFELVTLKSCFTVPRISFHVNSEFQKYLITLILKIFRNLKGSRSIQYPAYCLGFPLNLEPLRTPSILLILPANIFTHILNLVHHHNYCGVLSYLVYFC